MSDTIKTITALGMCFGVPYVMSQATSNSTPSAAAIAPPAASASAGPRAGLASQQTPLYTPGGTAAEAQAFAPPQPGVAGQPTPDRLEGPKFADFAEVFRFDVNVAWMMNRWARVSTAAREFSMQGYRVALMTGTRPDDIAGALTYYFTTDHQVGKITFIGATGDPRRLVSTLQALHGFDPVVGTEPGVFLWEIRRVPGMLGVLRIRPGEVVTSDNPWSRYRVELAIERGVPVVR